MKLFGGVVLSAAARTDYLTIAITGQNDMVKVAATTGLSLTTIAALTALVFLVVPLGALALALRARPVSATVRRIENQDLTPSSAAGRQGGPGRRDRLRLSAEADDDPHVLRHAVGAEEPGPHELLRLPARRLADERDVLAGALRGRSR